MTLVNSVLVIARLTAGSDELHEAMVREARRAPTCFTLVVPRDSGAPGSTLDAASRLERALARATAAGLQVCGRLGNDDPVIAALENFDPWQIDRIVVCTLPAAASVWSSAADVPGRIRRRTGAPVIHVHAPAARMPEPAPAAA